ncbi:MAG: PilZ domain-containing protein, partial [Candidatus Sulfotelmatobacter sp.]
SLGAEGLRQPTKSSADCANKRKRDSRKSEFLSIKGKSQFRGEIMDSTSAAQPCAASDPSDRRRNTRYRYSAPISVHTSEGLIVRAMTLEISEGGASAMLASPVKIGESVKLEPIASGMVTAQVRHKVGKIYGFQFLQISEAQRDKLRDDCRRLPVYPPNNKMGI